MLNWCIVYVTTQHIDI